jgi:large subunit ribosomal protein L25
VSTLLVGQTLHLTDITFPAGVASVELAKGADHDQAVVTVNPPKAAPAEEESAEDEAE